MSCPSHFNVWKHDIRRNDDCFWIRKKSWRGKLEYFLTQESNALSLLQTKELEQKTVKLCWEITRISKFDFHQEIYSHKQKNRLQKVRRLYIFLCSVDFLDTIMLLSFCPRFASSEHWIRWAVKNSLKMFRIEIEQRTRISDRADTKSVLITSTP